MPGGDRTGPMGMGPMTGRGAGYCGGFGMSGAMNRGFGGRRGRGRRGWRHVFHATGLTGRQRAAMAAADVSDAASQTQGIAPQEEIQALRAQAEAAAATLDRVRRRIEELAAGEDGRCSDQ